MTRKELTTITNRPHCLMEKSYPKRRAGASREILLWSGPSTGILCRNKLRVTLLARQPRGSREDLRSSQSMRRLLTMRIAGERNGQHPETTTSSFPDLKVDSV